MDDLSCYGIAFLWACDEQLVIYETDQVIDYLQNLLNTMVDEMHIWNFRINAVEHTVEARLFDENSHNGYSIWFVKFLKIGPLFVDMMKLVIGIGEGKERL